MLSSHSISLRAAPLIRLQLYNNYSHNMWPKSSRRCVQCRTWIQQPKCHHHAPTFHRSGCQKQPKLLHRACLRESFVQTCQNLAWRRLSSKTLCHPTCMSFEKRCRAVVKKRCERYRSNNILKLIIKFC
jgi:hypothetical protein